MIPANRLSPPAVRNLLDYLIDQLLLIQRDRMRLEEIWMKHLDVYRARPKLSRKDFPFVGASNLVIPVVATDVETIYARILGTLFAPRNLLSVTPSRPELVAAATKIEDFLQWAQENEIDWFNPLNDYILQMIKLGTGVIKQRYVREMKKAYEWRETDQGVFEQQVMLLLKDSPQVNMVDLFDFYLPPMSRSIQEAAWVAERISLTPEQFANRVRAGIYTGLDRIGAWQNGARGTKFDLFQAELQRYTPSRRNEIGLYEFWLDYDIDADGEPEAVLCTIHPESFTYARLDFNPFFNQDRPYSASRYMRVEKQFYGIGLCEMLEYFQEEVSTMHNQRIDNATIGNAQMYAARKDSGIKKNEPIYVGKIWLLNNLDDVKPITMGSPMASTIPAEQQTINYAQRRTGVNDYIAGVNSADIGYGTAYTTNAMLQNAGKRFDQVMREVRECVGEAGVRVVEMYQQFNQNGKEFYALGNEAGSMVREILQFPLDLVRRGFKISVTATDAATSKAEKIRENSILMQQLQGFNQQLLQIMMMLLNPQIPPQLRPVLLQMMQGGALLMEQTLEAYGRVDAERFVPNLGQNDGLQQLLAAASPVGVGSTAIPGGPGGVAGPPAQPGLGAGASGFAGASPNGYSGVSAVQRPPGPGQIPGGAQPMLLGAGASNQPSY